VLHNAHGELPADVRRELDVAQRNGQRLLKLVNMLLDLSRIEAGRMEASYEPTDLAALTADLASVFRSAIERAGLRLIVDCPPLPQAVYVDRELWEKIVLNLISNAFKFTLRGEIAVGVHRAGDRAVLTVRDTGVGVPAEATPHLFERFYRVRGSEARTQEGTGIGLVLARELVQLHGGTIAVESAPGQGATFTVTVPAGTAHLPDDQICAARTLASTAIGASAYVEEALRRLPDAPASGPDPFDPSAMDTPAGAGATFPFDGRHARILLADDNADMREYLARLLRQRWTVEAVADGAAALAAARERRPDLVISDVMMPKLDGFGLLQALRAEPGTAHVPVLLLSARAGEEARVEGLEAGADDYLVKPFSARELIARVGAHLELARVRDEAAAKLRESEERLRRATQAARISAWEVDLRTGVTAVAPSFAETLGYPADCFPMPMSEAIRTFSEPEDASAQQQAIAEAIAGDGNLHIESRFHNRRTDAVLWLESTGQVVRGADGAPLRLIGVTQDVTARKQAEEAVATAASRDAFRVRLADALRPLAHPDQIQTAATRLLGEHLGASRVLYAEIGDNGQTAVVEANYVRVGVPSVIGRSRLRDFGRIVAETLHAGRTLIFGDYARLPHLTPAERAAFEAVNIRANISVPLLKDDQLVAFLSVHQSTVRDWSPGEISLIEETAERTWAAVERARAAAALREQVKAHIALNAALRETAEARDRALAETQEAMRVRGEFLAAVSHDLRTPLTTVRGLVQLTRRQAARMATPEAERLGERLELADSAAGRMASMLNGVLDLARLESGRSLELERKPHDLAALLCQLVAEQQQAAPHHRILLDLQQPSLEGVWDAGRLERVIGNLLGNAVKYSPAGGDVQVTLAAETRAGSRWARITIADHGVGIPAADLPRLFERFHRGSNVVGRIRGVGVGLAAAKQIVDEHGGTLEFESSEGHGTTATLRLPCEPPAGDAGA